MSTKKQTSGHESRITVHGIPPDSELPAATTPPSLEEVVPQPDEDTDGMNNLPEELLSTAQQIDDELNHLGMEVEPPGEDEAPVEADEERREPRPRRGPR